MKVICRPAKQDQQTHIAIVEDMVREYNDKIDRLFGHLDSIGAWHRSPDPKALCELADEYGVTCAVVHRCWVAVTDWEKVRQRDRERLERKRDACERSRLKKGGVVWVE
jgi:hypothetical protein